jgi:hypothetical protein
MTKPGSIVAVVRVVGDGGLEEGGGREAVATAGPGVDVAAAARTFYHLLFCLDFSFSVFLLAYVLLSIFISI